MASPLVHSITYYPTIKRVFPPMLCLSKILLYPSVFIYLFIYVHLYLQKRVKHHIPQYATTVSKGSRSHSLSAISTTVPSAYTRENNLTEKAAPKRLTLWSRGQ